MLLTLLDAYIEYCDKIAQINKHLKRKIRNCNFPSEISENIVAELFNYEWKNVQKGDLIDSKKGRRVEVKGFRSTGPISFGPTEYWDVLYLVDCREYNKYRFRVYEIPFSSTHTFWKNLPVNQNQTFEDHCRIGRRPRQSFENIVHHFGRFCNCTHDIVLK